MKKRFKSKKDVIDYLSTKGIDASYWDESKWRSLNTSPAEIHIQALAEAIWDAMKASTPKELKGGEWHVPFGDQLDYTKLRKEAEAYVNAIEEARAENVMDTALITYDFDKIMHNMAIKIATARCARLSYMTFDKEIDYKKDIELYDRLLSSKHMSPFEHCAKAMSDTEFACFVKGPIFGHKFYKYVAHPTIPGVYLHKDSMGWCNNFKGFIQQRYMLDNPGVTS